MGVYCACMCVCVCVCVCVQYDGGAGDRGGEEEKEEQSENRIDQASNWHWHLGEQVCHSEYLGVACVLGPDHLPCWRRAYCVIAVLLSNSM